VQSPESALLSFSDVQYRGPWPSTPSRHAAPARIASPAATAQLTDREQSMAGWPPLPSGAGVRAAVPARATGRGAAKLPRPAEDVSRPPSTAVARRRTASLVPFTAAFCFIPIFRRIRSPAPEPASDARRRPPMICCAATYCSLTLEPIDGPACSPDHAHRRRRWPASRPHGPALGSDSRAMAQASLAIRCRAMRAPSAAPRLKPRWCPRRATRDLRVRFDHEVPARSVAARLERARGWSGSDTVPDRWTESLRRHIAATAGWTWR